MKKRKMLLLALAVSMVAILAVGGTLAYFTDTDTAKNTFVVGNIKIKLNEYNAQPDWTQTKPEGMSQEDWDKGLQDDDYRDWLENNWDTMLMPGTEIPKYVVVKNVGTRAAICWIEVWLPKELDETGSLHILYEDHELNDLYNNGNAFLHSKTLGDKTIGTVEYTGYAIWGESDDHTAQSDAGSGCGTMQLMHHVKMDEAVQQVINADGSISWILADGKTAYDGSWDVIVNAIGFQMDNVDTIANAMNSYYNGGSTSIP